MPVVDPDRLEFHKGGLISGADNGSVLPEPHERVIPLRLLREHWEGRMTLAEVYEAAGVKIRHDEQDP